MMKANDAYQIEKIDNGLIFYTRYYGKMTLDHLMMSSKERVTDPEFPNAVFSLLNTTEASLTSLTPDDIRTFANYTRKVLLEKPHLVLIVVVNSGISYGLSRIWLGNTRPASPNLHVVRSEKEATNIIDKVRKERNL